MSERLNNYKLIEDKVTPRCDRCQYLKSIIQNSGDVQEATTPRLQTMLLY